MGVNIRITIPCHHIQKNVMEIVFFLSLTYFIFKLNVVHNTSVLLTTFRVMTNRVSFFSVRLRCENYSDQIYILICTIGKNRTGSDPANQKATILCTLFCHQKYSTNNAQNYLMWELSHYITVKGPGLRSFRKGYELKMHCHNCYVCASLWSHK